MLLDILEFIKDSFFYILIAIFVLFLATYIVSPASVNGDSMSPTLKDGEVLVLNKAKMIFGSVDRFDIVVVKYGSPNYIIKRVIGLPGESIEYKENILYINGRLVDEPYLNNITTPDFSLEKLGLETIPDNMYFIAGDNREVSVDSRDTRVGLVSEDDIMGTASFVMWPFTKLRFTKWHIFVPFFC